MYIWLGIDVDSQLDEIKEETKRIEKEIGFIHSNFTLPFHISLKISFNIKNEDYNSVIDDLTSYFQTLNQFIISVKGIEYENTIAWIMMNTNQYLNDIHDQLNKLLGDKYHVPLHEYDLDYKFHTTLFMDDDQEKVKKAYDLIKDNYVPSFLVANKFLIGMSEEGKLGTYKVIKEIIK